MRKQEWDWPAEQSRRSAGYDVDAVPRGTGWASPTAKKVSSIYLRSVWMFFRFVMGGILAAIILAVVWVVLKVVSI